MIGTDDFIAKPYATDKVNANVRILVARRVAPAGFARLFDKAPGPNDNVLMKNCKQSIRIDKLATRDS